MKVQIRPASEDRDLTALRVLYHALLSEPPTEDFVRRIINNAHVHVAEQNSGEVVGFCLISRRNTMPPEQAFVWVTVAPEHRRRGIGSLLMEHPLQQASTLGFIELISRVDDDQSAGKAFCEAFGFEPNRHMVNLVLHVDRWDRSVLEAQLDRARTNGIEFITFAGVENIPANQQRLYALNKTLSASIPIEEPEDFPTFEPYVERRLSGGAFPHEGIHLAVDGDRWVAMSQVSLHEEHAFVEMTGVLPAYRGRGIAQALKVLGIDFAAHHNYKIIKTINDACNHPMIAVNEKAGFKKERGFYFVRRQLSTAAY